MAKISYTRPKARRQPDYHKANPYDPFYKTDGYRKAVNKAAKYGLTLRENEQMFHAQNGCCAGCGERFEPCGMRIDHCHASGQVRGILCHSCNIALGWVRDNPKTLTRLAAYLISTVGPVPANG